MIVPKQIIRSSRKSLALTLNDRGDLIVKAPLYMPLEKIYEFIVEKEKWIDKKQKYIKQTLSQNEQIINYNSIFFLGKLYDVVEIKGIEQHYLTNSYLAIEKTWTLSKKIENIKQFYLENTKQIIMPRVEKYAKKIGVNPSLVKIINSTAKWGMCDSKNQIYINWKVIMLLPELIDYVIVHELSHLKQLNHSKAFWNVVSKEIPSYKQSIEMIKKSNFLIKLF